MKLSNNITLGNDNVFEDLGFSVEEAVNLKIRSDLMLKLQSFIKEKGWNQQESADFFDESQFEISNLMNGEISQFTVDKLLNLLSKAGMAVKVEVFSNG